MTSVGVVFISTGGEKILRAIRSLRRTEPDLPIHVVFDALSRTWVGGGYLAQAHLAEYNNVNVRLFDNQHHINGVLNEGMRWMRDLGHSHACLFHDDIIFTPFKEHKGHLSDWFFEV